MRPRWWEGLALAVGGLLLVYVAGWCGGQTHARAAAQLDADQVLLHGHHAYMARLDSARAVAEALARSEAAWKAKAAALASVGRDTIVTVHHDTITVPDTVTLQTRVVYLGAALSACDARAGALDAALGACKARGDSLERALDQTIRTHECRWLLVPCPSRGVTFILGAALGVYLAHR